MSDRYSNDKADEIQAALAAGDTERAADITVHAALESAGSLNDALTALAAAARRNG